MTIPVTKAFLPPLEDYQSYLQGIWERGWLTNNGPLVLELEEKLRSRLGVKHLFFVNNGTIAIQIALKALDCKGGEVITTPFSYVATTSSVVWEGFTPVFADIDPRTLCLDPRRVEEAITDRTVAILATHVFGTPCDVDAFRRIETEHGIPVLYDAAHAFGVSVQGRSVLTFGSMSTLSFHATKVFHTAEGGAIVTENDELAHKISYLRNFGHNGPEQFFGLGVNGKSSEFHAGIGLSVLKCIPTLLEKRERLARLYDDKLQQLFDDGFIVKPALLRAPEGNNSYYPVLFRSEEELLVAVQALREREIQPRRYFYPSLSTLPYVDATTKVPVGEDISKRVLCLPFYPQLTDAECESVVEVLRACHEHAMASSQAAVANA